MPIDRSSKRAVFRNRKLKDETGAKAEKESLLKIFVVPATLALLALLGTVIGSGINAWTAYKKNDADDKLADKKYQSDLVLKALESGSLDERLKSLGMLVRTKLIKDREVQDSVSNYLDEVALNPNLAQQVKSSTSQQPEPLPLRIYLLAGNEAKGSLFNEVTKDLLNSGYSVLRAKVFEDSTRKDTPSVRYFNDEDKKQAEAIAQSLKVKFTDGVPVNKILDASAKSGYIEIWLGR